MANNSSYSFAPGRINLIGEHTDYNNGFVLPAAIDLGCTCKIQSNHSQVLRIWAEDIGEYFEVDTTLELDIIGMPTWFKFLLGVFMIIREKKQSIGGIDVHFSSTIPVGAGLSSSAAICCSFIYGLNHHFNLKLSNWNMILIAQQAEHIYAGIRCGVMDQFASICGKSGSVMLLDCKTLDSRSFPIDLGEHKIILVNSRVTHELASSEYNIRRQTCESSVEKLKSMVPSIESLRDVGILQLEKYASILSTEEYNCSSHVVLENLRVQQATKAIEDNDSRQLGILMYASHHSLRELYQVSCVELDSLVDIASEMKFVLGSRMMGGGFGGCTINIVATQHKDEFKDQILKVYQEKHQLEPYFYELSLGDGARLIN